MSGATRELRATNLIERHVRLPLKTTRRVVPGAGVTQQKQLPAHSPAEAAATAAASVLSTNGSSGQSFQSRSRA